MKLLFDPVFTNDPAFCSMTWKMQNAAKFLVDQRDDVFIRFALPGDIDGNKWDISGDWLFKHPRVEYFTVPTYNDRMREYYRFAPELENAIKFWGDWWDNDIIVTARIPMVPIMKPAMTAMRFNRPYAKQIVTVEDMPILGFKKCVAQCQPEMQDRSTVMGYAQADLASFMSFWEKDAMLRVARGFLAPSEVQRISKHSINSSPIRVEPVKAKSADLLHLVATHEKAFTVGYTQRYEKMHRRSDDIMDIFEKQWIFHGGKKKMRFVSTSNSKGGMKDSKFIEFLRPPREEFWRMMREEVDVILVMSIDDAYPLSLIEPILQGTPAIVLDVPYARATLTPDYPFFIKNEIEAYGLVKAFHDDYLGMYAKFEEWLRNKYDPLMQERNKSWFPQQLLDFCNGWDLDMESRLALSERVNAAVDPLVEAYPDELTIHDAFKDLHKAGKIGHLANEIGTEAKTSNSFTASWNEYRLRLIHHHGYKDASINPGHMKRAK